MTVPNSKQKKNAYCVFVCPHIVIMFEASRGVILLLLPKGWTCLYVPRCILGQAKKIHTRGLPVLVEAKQKRAENPAPQ